MRNTPKTHIKEIFTSIQGEGVCVGEKHIFVRFCKCNLKCAYCDTDFSYANAKEYTIDELYERLKDVNCETISFTGGEPLSDIEFLLEFLKRYKNKLNKKIYLETNGTLYQNFVQIIDFVDIVAMDIKLESATRQRNRYFENEKFLHLAQRKELFIKVVFDENINEAEIDEVARLAKTYKRGIILQPKMPINNNVNLYEIFEKFYSKHKDTRLICQTHKFLNLQ
ncbi:MAG: 7-carboxy-7-deazaguanine synthase QueE [Candidatus Gastranaerophilales bacterium]|nr:7-carboxy-7-deazaguanine synthase QueE [Candidatus Gastranaerophilales bacterium]